MATPLAVLATDLRLNVPDRADLSQQSMPVCCRSAVGSFPRPGHGHWLSSSRHVHGNGSGRRSSVSCGAFLWFGLARHAEVETPTADADSQRVQEDEVAEMGWDLYDDGQFQGWTVIGRGSYGTVFQVEDKANNRTVAVKKIRKKRPKMSREKVLERLEREATILQELQVSPALVRLHGRCEDPDSAYLVMEHIAGDTLQDLMAVRSGGRLTEPELLLVAKSILEFLAACHSRGILYGDVKPANFMFSGGSSPVRVIDCGCSQREASSLNGVFKTRCGTPAYFAPEVFLRSFTVKADIWSLGIMLYHLSIGRFPYWEDMSDVTPQQVMECVTHRSIPFVDVEWSHLSPEFQELVTLLLEKNPSHRPSAEEALQHRALAMLSKAASPERNVSDDDHNGELGADIVMAQSAHRECDPFSGVWLAPQ